MTVVGEGTYLTSPHSKQSIQSTPCCRETCGIGLVAAQVQVGRKEEHRWEHHGKNLERSSMLGGNKSRKECWRHGVLYMMLVIPTVVCHCIYACEREM
jgi:hypothetical protein